MSRVPYIFAGNTGNIPLSDLDVNFANCKAFTDSAGIVTANAQPNIRSVGVLNTLSVAGNVRGSYFIGNGSQLTGISVSSVLANLSVLGNVTGGNLRSDGGIEAVTNITAQGNVIGAYILGDGSQLTGITSEASSNAALLTGSTLSPNVTSSSLTSVGTLGTLSVTGNVRGSYFIGNGSQLTGLPANYGNADVATFLAAFGSNAISTTGNITGSYLFGDGSQLTGITSSASSNAALLTGTTLSSNVTSSALNSVGTLNSLSVTGNVTANNFIGGGVETPTIASIGNLNLSSPTSVAVIGGGTFRLPGLTATEIANIVAANGDMVYNSTVNKFQGYENGAWGNLI